jgi:tetratricopeptide (TPR) repeat protein
LIDSRLGAGLTFLSLVTLSAALPTGAKAQQRAADAENALRTGRYDEAVALFSDLVRDEPSSARAARGYAKASSEIGRYDDAERAARRFIESNPDSPELWNTLGEVLYAVGHRDEAADAFQRAITGKASDELDARLNAAIARYDRGDVEESKREFDRFIDVYNRGGGRGLSSQDLTAVATAVRYLGADDWELYRDALKAYDEAIAADPGNLEPRVRVGELFLEKYNSQDAADAFEDVLELNSTHPRATLGMAKLLRFDGRPGALDLVRKSLETNPNYVSARTFAAELWLELENYEAAADEVERALEVNPASLEALAVLAAIRRLQGDERGFAEARDRVLELNPRYAGLYTKLAELSARNRLYFEAVDFARKAVQLDAGSWRGYALLGINQLRVGVIDEGYRNLEIAFDGDPFDIWTKNTLDLLDTFEGYEETRTPRFVITVDKRESALLSLYFSDLAEEAYDRLAELYGYRPPTPVRVEVFRNHADFSVRTVGLVGFGALGVSFGPVIAMDAPSARRSGEYNWGSTFWHELAHTFHLGLTDHKVPRWFSEGLAVFEERRARPGWGDDVSPGFLTAYLQDRLLPVAELNNGFTRPAYPEQLIYSYLEASLVCEFIDKDWGPEALVGMLGAYRDGLSTDQAFRRVLGSGVDDFGDRFFAFLQRRFAVPLAAMRPDRVTHEQPSMEQVARWAQEDAGDFAAQLTYGHILFEQGRREEAVAYLKRAKELFPEYAGSGSPYWYLALIYKERGSLVDAEQELTALTELNERDLNAHMELAEIREAMGDLAGAATALGRINYISPYEASLHTRLASLYSEIGEYEKAVRERRAVLALDPVDRVEALYQLALAYYEAGDMESARRTVLNALEDAPSFEAAQDLLLEIRAGGGGTP